jgi:DNA-binding LytR/AlgR family response regulator
MRILVAEDEDLIRAEVVRLVRAQGGVWASGDLLQAEDGVHAMELVDDGWPDVAFLDIQMPGLTGLQVAQRLRATALERGVATPLMVFVTAYNEHAIAAFDAGAVDYLLKPVKAERMAETAARLTERLAARGTTALGPDTAAQAALDAVLKQLLPAAAARAEPLRWISASVGNQIKLITVDEIVFLQSDNKYTRLVTATSEAFVRKPLRELLDELDPTFFKQVHRSTVVNMRCVASVLRDGTGRGTAQFKNHAEKVEVSAAYMGLFRAL